MVRYEVLENAAKINIDNWQDKEKISDKYGTFISKLTKISSDSKIKKKWTSETYH